ncbi:MAG: pyrroline-5-carboxylate reductase [bacterium]
MIPENAKLAILGAGKMGETLASALIDASLLRPEQILVTARHPQRMHEVAQRLGVKAAASNAEAARAADMILLCVKPQVSREVLDEINPVLRTEHLLISILASATTSFIENYLKTKVAVVRAMPNTPSLLRVGMTVLCAGKHAQGKHLEQAQRIFDAVGRTMIMDEKYMDAVTALSASGPAYIYVVLESLAEGGVKVGLPRHIATELAAQMCLGAAKMVLETKAHPALLKDAVTTPAGCTIDGLLRLEEGGLRVTLIKAVVEATHRAKQLIES